MGDSGLLVMNKDANSYDFVGRVLTIAPDGSVTAGPTQVVVPGYSNQFMSTAKAAMLDGSDTALMVYWDFGNLRAAVISVVGDTITVGTDTEIEPFNLYAGYLAVEVVDDERFLVAYRPGPVDAFYARVVTVDPGLGDWTAGIQNNIAWTGNSNFKTLEYPKLTRLREERLLLSGSLFSTQAGGQGRFALMSVSGTGAGATNSTVWAYDGTPADPDRHFYVYGSTQNTCGWCGAQVSHPTATRVDDQHALLAWTYEFGGSRHGMARLIRAGDVDADQSPNLLYRSQQSFHHAALAVGDIDTSPYQLMVAYNGLATANDWTTASVQASIIEATPDGSPEGMAISLLGTPSMSTTITPERGDPIVPVRLGDGRTVLVNAPDSVRVISPP